MKRRVLFLVFAALGVGLFIAGCSLSAVSQTGGADIGWGTRTLAAVAQDNFLGYLVPLIIATIAMFLHWSLKVRFAMLGFSMVYLGFYLGLRLSGLGGPTTFTMFLTEQGIKTNWSFYLTWAVVIIGAVSTGRLFCGWLCPMGAVQQFLYRREHSLQVSPKLHRWLSYVRYALLVLIVFTTAAFATRYWGSWDPFRTLFRGLESNGIGQYALMGVVLLASVFVFAPWCRYACPLGAVLGLFSRISAFKVRIDAVKCNDCKRCARIDCAYGAISAGAKGEKPTVNYFDCTGCGECIAKCPQKAFTFSTSASKVAEESKETGKVTEPS